MNTERRLSERIGRLGSAFIALWLVLAALILLSLLVDMRIRPHWLLTVYSTATVLFSVALFVMYGVDKRRARKNQRRISERTLHGFALLGGWPGAYFGQRVFRHKTQKLPFRAVFWATVVLHVGVVAYALWASVFGTSGS